MYGDHWKRRSICWTWLARFSILGVIKQIKLYFAIVLSPRDGSCLQFVSETSKSILSSVDLKSALTTKKRPSISRINAHQIIWRHVGSLIHNVLMGWKWGKRHTLRIKLGLEFQSVKSLSLMLTLWEVSLVLDCICLTTTHPWGHISRPTQVDDSHNCFHSLNRLFKPDCIVQVRGQPVQELFNWGIVMSKTMTWYWPPCLNLDCDSYQATSHRHR